MEIDLSPTVYFLDYCNLFPEKEVFDRGRALNYMLKNGKLYHKKGSVYYGTIKKVKESHLPSNTEIVVVIVDATTGYECQTQVFS